jgi:hypothetical protein
MPIPTDKMIIEPMIKSPLTLRAYTRFPDLIFIRWFRALFIHFPIQAFTHCSEMALLIHYAIQSSRRNNQMREWLNNANPAH